MATTQDDPQEVKCGVVIFDNPNKMTEGWACSEGGEPFRISSIFILPSDTVWVTNLDFEEYSKVGSRVHNIRPCDYLRCALSHIAADIGLRLDGALAHEAVGPLADVFSRTIKVAAKAYEWQSPASEVRDRTLAADIRRSMPKEQSSPNVSAALTSAFQKYSSPVTPNRFDTNVINVTLRFNRVAYASQVMATQIPDGGWNFIPPESAGEVGLTEWLDPDRPSLVSCLVDYTNSDPGIAELAAYGCTVGRRSRVRSWMSQVELRWLSEHANITVVKGFRSNSARSIPPEFRLPEYFTANPLNYSFVSVGLVCESHWQGLADAKWIRTTKESEPTVMGCWLRAMDRALCFKLALQVQACGFQVSGYGNGSVLVKVQRSDISRLHQFAISNKIPHPSFDRLYAEHGRVN